MKVIISGYGKMGHMVEEVLSRRGIELVDACEDICSVDPAIAGECVCIDFTTPDAFRANYKTLAKNFKAVVVGTTGWADIKQEVFDAFKSNDTTMIWASNFSIGVNVFFAAVEKASQKLSGHGYQPYIEEKHHIHKLDAPSGTAVSLADIVEKGLGERPEIASVRCGEIAGIHTVDFEGPADRITLTHEAFSRKGFAEGAVEAAVMTEGLKGVYEFKDLILR